MINIFSKCSIYYNPNLDIRQCSVLLNSEASRLLLLSPLFVPAWQAIPLHHPFSLHPASFHKIYKGWHNSGAEHFDTDIGTEELAHLEIICAIVHQLTRNLTPEEIVASGFDKYYVDHTLALWPQAAGGIPFNACEFQSKGDPITDLTEDMAADTTIAKEQLANKIW